MKKILLSALLLSSLAIDANAVTYAYDVASNYTGRYALSTPANFTPGNTSLNSNFNKGGKYYLNAGHGGFDSNDRPTEMPLIGEMFYESEGNLDRTKHLQQFIIQNGGQVKMQRTTNTSADDWDLTAIASASSTYGGYFISLHSNAANASANYQIALYKGQNSTNSIAGSERMAYYNSYSAYNNGCLSNATYTTPRSMADYDLMGWHYGVLNTNTQPGYLVETWFHDYRPESLRFKSSLYNKFLAWQMAIGNFTAPGGTGSLPGCIIGDVRDTSKGCGYSSYATRGRDSQLALNDVTVTLSGNGLNETVTTGSKCNGVYAFFVPAGTYTLTFKKSGYKSVTKSVTVANSKASQNNIDMSEGTDNGISVNPTSTGFGETAVGNTSTKTITVTAASLTANITISNSDNTHFAINKTSLGTTGGTFDVTYKPQKAGSHSTTITLTSGSYSAVVKVTGTSVAKFDPNNTYEISMPTDMSDWFKTFSYPGSYCLQAAIINDRFYTLPAVNDANDMIATYYTKGYFFDSATASTEFSGGSGDTYGTMYGSGSAGATYNYAGPHIAADDAGTLWTTGIRGAYLPTSYIWSEWRSQMQYWTKDKLPGSAGGANRQGVSLGNYKITGRSDLMSAYGDCLGGTGYFWFCIGDNGNSKKIERITMQNGTPTANTQFTAPDAIGNFNNRSTIDQYAANKVCLSPGVRNTSTSGTNTTPLYKGVINGSSIEWTDLGVKAYSPCATMAEFCGHEILVYASTNTQFTIRDVTEGKDIAKITPWGSANGSGSSWVQFDFDIKVDGTTAYIYVYTPAVGGARYSIKAYEKEKAVRGHYAYGLSMQENGDQYTLNFNSTGEVQEGKVVLTNIATEEEIEIAVNGVAKGKNSVTVDRSSLTDGAIYNWSVVLDNPASAIVGTIFTDNSIQYYNGSYNCRGGVAIDKDTESPNFGTLYTSTGSAFGIQRYTPELTKNGSPILKSYFTGDNIHSPYRIETNGGKLYIADNAYNNPGVWVYDPAKGEVATNMFVGTNDGNGQIVNGSVATGGQSTGVAFIGEGADRKMYTFSEDYPTINGGNKVLRYDLGQNDTWAAAPSAQFDAVSALLANANVELVATDKGVFCSQTRYSGNNVEGIPAFAHIAHDGTVTFNSATIASTLDGCNGGGMAIYGDLFAIVDGSANILLYNVKWNGSTPSFTYLYTVATPSATIEINQLEFDPAGNIYAYSRQEGLLVYALKHDARETITAAPEALVLEGPEVIVGVEGIEVEIAPAVYYNLQGVQVENPTSGIYIVKRGNKVTKERIVR